MKPALIQLIVALVVLLLLGGGYVFWYDHVQALDARAGALGAEIASKDAERSRSASARSGEAELAAQEAFVASHLVATADIVSFLERLEKTGRGFGAEVHVASVSDTVKASDGRISLSLSVAGPFDAVMRTIGAIEQGPYAMSVQDLSLDTADGSSWSATGVFVAAIAATSTAP